MTITWHNAVPDGTHISKFELTADLAYWFKKLRIEHSQQAIALMADGRCVGVLVTPEEYSLFLALENIAASPKTYQEIQDVAAALPDKPTGKDFVAGNIVFRSR